MADWSVMFMEGIEEVVERAATIVADDWNGLTEYEDLRNEAFILMATKKDLQGVARSGRLGILHHRLICDLKNHMQSAYRRTRPDLALSYEELRNEAWDEAS